MFRAFLVLLMVLCQQVSIARTVTLTPDKVNDWIALTNPKADKRLGGIIMQSAVTHKVSPAVIVAIMSVESKFIQTAHSSGGAVSYMQVVPKYHAKRIRGRNLWDPSVNVDVGTAIIRLCADQYGNTVNSILRCYTGGYGKWYNQRVMREMNSFVGFVNGT